MPNEDLHKVLPVGDVFAVTPDYEGLGIVYIEALALGIPVIASNVGGILDIIKDGKNGMLVKPGDITSLSEKLEELLQNKDMQQRFITNGFRTIEENFLWENIFSKMEKIYFKVIK